MTVSTVFFDLDGTLVDTTWFHTLAWWRALVDHGHVIPMAEIHPLIGMGGKELLGTLIGAAEPGASDAHDSYFKEYRDSATPLPGASELLLTLRAKPVQLVLVTSSKPDDADALLGLLDARGLFDHIVHGDEVERTKPEPDLFHLALERVSVEPGEALAVGDAQWDIQAAGKAGVPSVGVETGGTSADLLVKAGAIETYRSCKEILEGWSTGLFADVS